MREIFFPIGGLSNLDDPPHFFEGFRVECQAKEIICDEGRLFANETGFNVSSKWLTKSYVNCNVKISNVFILLFWAHVGLVVSYVAIKKLYP